MMVRNPVMFVVEVGSVLTTVLFVRDLLDRRAASLGFIARRSSLWLWFTVLFANFAEAMAEGRGKAQADALRRTRTETPGQAARAADARRRIATRAGAEPAKGDLVLVEAGDFIPRDGEVIEGVASVDEAAITGEIAPGDPRERRRPLRGHRRHAVLSDWIVVRITADPGETFLDRMIALVEGAERQKTPNEIALNILLAGLTIIFLLRGRAPIPSFARLRRRRRSPVRRRWSRCSCA